MYVYFMYTTNVNLVFQNTRKRMKWREGKRMNERNVRILIAAEDGQCVMFA